MIQCYSGLVQSRWGGGDCPFALVACLNTPTEEEGTGCQPTLVEDVRWDVDGAFREVDLDSFETIAFLQKKLTCVEFLRHRITDLTTEALFS